MKVDIRDANLPELVARMQAGEEVVIGENGEAVARLVAPDVPPAPRPRFQLGMLEGLGGTVPDFPPIPDEDLDRWEREEERVAAGLGKPAGRPASSSTPVPASSTRTRTRRSRRSCVTPRS